MLSKVAKIFLLENTDILHITFRDNEVSPSLSMDLATDLFRELLLRFVDFALKVQVAGVV